MNRKDLIKIVAKRTKQTYAKTKLMFDIVFEIIEEELKNERKVQLMGFGTFFTTKEPAKELENVLGRGKTVYLEEKIYPRFKAGTALKKRINTKQG